MTEFEAERERLATLMDFLLELDGVREQGKAQLSLDEVEELVYQFAKKVKIHKLA